MRKNKTNQSRRGQAALEFLSTYGFAFLIILVMIGALAYFGVLNPTNFIPERCAFSGDLGCEDYQVLGGGANVQLLLNVRNNVGETVNVNAVTLDSEFCPAGPDGCTADCTASGLPVQIQAGAVERLDCVTTAAATFPSSGEKVRLQVGVTYQELGATALPNRANGEVFASIT